MKSNLSDYLGESVASVHGHLNLSRPRFKIGPRSRGQVQEAEAELLVELYELEQNLNTLVLI